MNKTGIILMLIFYLITVYISLCVFRYSGKNKMFASFESIVIFMVLSIIPFVNVIFIAYSLLFVVFNNSSTSTFDVNKFARNFLKTKKKIKIEEEKERFSGRFQK